MKLLIFVGVLVICCYAYPEDGKKCIQVCQEKCSPCKSLCGDNILGSIKPECNQCRNQCQQCLGQCHEGHLGGGGNITAANFSFKDCECNYGDKCCCPSGWTCCNSNRRCCCNSG